MRLHATAAAFATAFGAATLLLPSAPLRAAEIPIGQHQTVAGMEIGAVYLQPIKMEPDGMMRRVDESDIHLEADIHAHKDNPNGFAQGDWIPYLQVRAVISKVGSRFVRNEDLMPMVASDGPHYGNNVKLDGPGKYHLKFTIMPPANDGHSHFGRHVDKETGVAPWFKPFDLEYDFVYAGTGKKGGY